MNEANWLAGTDPQPLLAYLLDRASDRKLRLFLCGCLRIIPLPDGRLAWQTFAESCRHLLETAERVADGEVPADERAQAEEAAWTAEYDSEGRMEEAGFKIAEEAYDEEEWLGPSGTRYWHRPPKLDYRAVAWEYAVAGHLTRALRPAVRDAFLDTGSRRDWRFGPSWLREHEPRQVQELCMRLLHDLFGNPFRPPALDPNWVVRDDDSVLTLARRIYEDRAFADLPILADALEDAGCADAALLGHCRSAGPHVRGCWVIDLLLGKT